jgi:hypothetical protein
MAGLAETAKLLVSLDLIDNMSAGIASAESRLASLEGQAATTNSRLAGLGSTIKSAAVGFVAFAAAAGVADILSGAAQAALEDEASVALLTQSLTANVRAWDGNRDAIEAVIKSRERLGVTDETQRDAIARLAAATHDINDALDAEAIALDLAAFKHIDLATATDDLVRVEAGRYRALAALGIVIKAGATQEEALAAVHKVTAGAAEELANTEGGKLKASQVAINEAMEKLGSSLLPALATGMQGISAVVGGVADVFGGFADILGGVGDKIGTTVGDLEKLNDVNNREAEATIAYNLALTELQSQFANGLITQDQYLAKGAQLEASFQAQIETSAGFTKATEESGTALDNLAGRAQYAALAADKTSTSLGDLSSIAGNLELGGLATDLQNTGSGLDQVGINAIAAANGLDITHTEVSNLLGPVSQLTSETGALVTALAGLPGGLGAGALGIDQTGGNVGAPGNQPTDTGTLPKSNQNQVDAKNRQTALDTAARKAQQDALQRQRDLTAAITDTYRTAKSLEDDYFARWHANALKKIQDVLTLAQKQHDAAIQAINDTLQTQLANNAKPVTAAQGALANVQNQQQLRNLAEAADAAYTALQRNTDPTQADALQKALRDAREALANFKAQLNINDLQAQQAVADAKARNDAKAATDAADATLAAAETKAKNDTLRENQRYAAQQKRFNDDLDKVLKETIKKHQSMNTALQNLINLIAHYAGTSAGIPKSKQGLEVPHESQSINITVNVPPITIGARAVTSALSTQASPSQSPYVRSGQVRPKFSPGN